VKILCAADTSDDGYRGLEVFARTIDRNAVDEIGILMVTWPAREATIWDRAQDLWLVEGDLHQAMEVTVERQMERFENVLRGHARQVVTITDAGEPSAKVLEHAASMQADLILLVATTDPAATAVSDAVSGVIAKSPVPVVVVHGSSVKI
jgi:nucleotide-binding universal stress UspA family protein